MKDALDTNPFIDAFRDEEAQAELLAFLTRALPFTFMSAVVMQELAAGARTAEAARKLQQGVFEPFERRRRVFVLPPVPSLKADGRLQQLRHERVGKAQRRTKSDVRTSSS